MSFHKKLFGKALGPLIGAGGGIGSAAMSAREARRQREWSRENYRHRFQWSMEDMEAAGLNPILAAGMGLGGGGTPSGASASMPNLSGVGDTVTSSIHKGAERKKMGVEETTIAKLGEKHVSDAAKNVSDIGVNEESKKLIQAQAGAADANRNHINTQNLIHAYGINSAMVDNKVAGKPSTEWARTAAEWGPVINAVSGVAAAWGFGQFLSRSPNAATALPKGAGKLITQKDILRRPQ